MSGRIFNSILVAAALLLASGAVHAQTYTSNTPYSCFGVGDLYTQGGAYNKTMGGVGIATRTNRYFSVVNPASITARDSLSFMADFSLYEDNRYFRQGDIKSASNIMNIGNLAISFPITRHSAFMIGITPYSGTGYGYAYHIDDPAIIGRTGNISYSASGQGGLYQFYAGGAVEFFKRLSLGAQFNYIFGQNERKYFETFTDKSYNGAQNGYIMQLSGISGKFGIQYEQPVGAKGKLTIGATYTTATPLKGYVEGYKYSTGTAASDTLFHRNDTLGVNSKVHLAGEIGVGVNFRYDDKLMVEFDYTRSDWTGSGMDSTPGFMGNSNPSSSHSAFTTTVSQSFRAGVEYTPNRNDVRYYYRRISYRAGVYRRNEYYKLDGHNVTSTGITLGATLPVFRFYNGLSLGMDIGQRGVLANNLIRERYIGFSVGINIFDIWFQQPRYD